MSRTVRCVLIDPPITVGESEAEPEAGKKRSFVYPPVGLTYLAASLRDSGVDARIIDAKSLELTCEATVQAAVSEEPDFIGVTVFTSRLKSSLDVCRGIKALRPTTMVVVGGPHIHPLHREVIQQDFIDFCLRGEGEITMRELIDALSNGGDPARVRGITFRDGGGVVVTPDRPMLQNLDALPFPARDLLAHDTYRLSTGSGEVRFAAVSASRGCPFDCHFCSVPRFWPRRRQRSAANVLDELRDVQALGVEFVRFTDELFTARRRWVSEFCQGMVERGLNTMAWSCDSRVDTISADLLEEMKRANCQVIFYGIEFGNQRILDLSGKKTAISQIYHVVRMTKEAGISPHANFMLGYPTETRQTIEDTIELACRVGVDGATFTIVTPFPGTELFDYCLEHNLLRTTDWEEYDYCRPDRAIIQLPDVPDHELAGLWKKANWEFQFRHVRDELRRELLADAVDLVEGVLSTAS